MEEIHSSLLIRILSEPAVGRCFLISGGKCSSSLKAQETKANFKKKRRGGGEKMVVEIQTHFSLAVGH